MSSLQRNQFLEAESVEMDKERNQIRSVFFSLFEVSSLVELIFLFIMKTET